MPIRARAASGSNRQGMSSQWEETMRAFLAALVVGVVVAVVAGFMLDANKIPSADVFQSPEGSVRLD